MLTFSSPMMTTTHRKPKQTRTAHRSPAVNRREGKRAHLPTSARPRVHHESLDIDQLYLSEMARSSTLTAETEAELAARIMTAERGILSGIVKAPEGRAALARLRATLASGTLDVRNLLLNPDQADLDLDGVRTRVLASLDEAVTDEALLETLSQARLAPEVVADLVTAVKAATHTTDRAQALLITKAQRELERSKQRLVVANLRLVVLFARKFKHRGVALLDLVQEGNLGLMRAAEKFDHRRGFRFSTYAAWWIKQALQRSLLDRSMRLPVHVADDRRRIGRVRAVFMTQQEREPTSEELAKLTGLGQERVETILNLPMQPSSLDQPMGDDGEASLGDFVAGDLPGPDDTVAQHALGGQLTELISTLNPREQEVLRLRFGVGEGDSYKEHTLEEVGRVLSLTRERIRQIERAALDKLRQKSERADLASYLHR